MESGLAVNGAIVNLNGQSDTTDSWQSLFNQYSSDPNLLRNGFYYFENIPAGMNPFLLKGGLYAVFVHRGPASSGEKTFRYIFGIWLPASEYVIDDRPHFEILGEKYKHDDPDSEEEIWIPVKHK